MFRFEAKKGNKPPEKGNKGTERLARVRESEHCSVPIPVPVPGVECSDLSSCHLEDGADPALRMRVWRLVAGLLVVFWTPVILLAVRGCVA